METQLVLRPATTPTASPHLHTWRASISSTRYSGRVSHCRSRLRPKGVVQWSSTAMSVPAVPPSAFSSTFRGRICVDKCGCVDTCSSMPQPAV
eukprot:353003-Chlamydomonas_euryale.AAC.3